MKVKYRYVFVVLVYKNIEVLRDFFKSLKVKNRHVIVVNSYYDDASLKECKEVAELNNADFIPIENKGFGYGNNVGAKYAIEHYEYEYLILSNSDIHVLDFKFMDDLKDFSGVLAPKIQMLTGKMQNPNIPWKIKMLYPLLHYGYNHKKKWCLTVGHIMTRLSREFFFLYSKIIKKDLYKIFCCHGAFIIFSANAVYKLYPFFNEKMFLYNEESYLAFLCEYRGVNVYYCPLLKIEHLEGASSHSGNEVLFNNNLNSFSILYSHIKNKDF